MKIPLLLLGILVAIQSASAQLTKADDSLLSVTTFHHASDFSHYQRPGNSDAPMRNRKKGLVARYNPISLVLKGSMWTYQHVITLQLSSPCPYQISCSNFAKQSIENFGIVKGMALAADRLMRCNRIALTRVPPLDIDPQTHHILDDPRWYTWHQK